MKVGEVDPNQRFRCSEPDCDDPVKPLYEFQTYKTKSSSGRTHRYYRTYCKRCAAKKRVRRRAARIAAGEPVREREKARRDRWLQKEENREAARDYQRIHYEHGGGRERVAAYRRSAKGKAKIQAWDKSPKGLARSERRNERRRQRTRENGAQLPSAVVQPYLAILHRWARADGGGWATVARKLCLDDDVYESTLTSIYSGKQKVCPPEVTDALTTYTELANDRELRERAKEWAMLTGDTWPWGRVYNRPRKKRPAQCHRCGKKFNASVPQWTRIRKGLPVFCDSTCANTHNAIEGDLIQNIQRQPAEILAASLVG